MENEYYGVATTPMDNYLAHYGIKGMKWGVRKAIERGSDRALSRQYAKAQKKLAKLEKRAANGKKYAKRASALGAGAAVAGGLAAAGTTKVGEAIRVGGKKVGGAMAGLGDMAYQAAVKNGRLPAGVRSKMMAGGMALKRAGSSALTNSRLAGEGLKQWGTASSSLAKDAATKFAHLQNRVNGTRLHQGYENVLAKQRAASGITNNTVARIGAGAIGAGLAGAAGYNAYRAATTKKAAKKAAQFRSEMNKAFAGTKYASGGNRQGGKRRKRR